MGFQKSVMELIRIRVSSRSYDGVSIPEASLMKLKDYLATISTEAGIKVRFILENTSGMADGAGKKLGTYGIIAGANSFVIGIIDKNEKDALRFGYLFEKIVLFATDLGLQTCWLGGTFNKNDFNKSIDIRENESIAIVSPVGTKKDKPRMLESAMRALVGANSRKPWRELFFDGDIATPLLEDGVGQYAVPLEMVRLGPSASNKQPWRVIREGNDYHFFLCRTKGYGVMNFDMQKNDLGIAKCHFELTAHELCIAGEWREMTQVKTPQDWEYICTWSNR